MTPDLSVVVPSVTGWDHLVECLDALRAQAASGVTLELLIIDRCGDAVRMRIRDRFPEAVVVAADRHTSIPAMRAMAFERARGPAIAVIEDHIIVPPGWSRQLLDVLAAGHDIVGGTVRNAATDRLVDWAAFLCEYSHMLPPLHAGQSTWLTGNNVVYRRTLLEKYRAVVARGHWEDELHAEMRRDGIALIFRPEIVVGHKRHYGVGEYLIQRYLYARAYAGLRRSQTSTLTRTVVALAKLALPPVLLVRIVSRVLAGKVYRAELVRSLPLLMLFVCAWTAGEVVGHAAGPGNALSRVT